MMMTRSGGSVRKTLSFTPMISSDCPSNGCSSKEKYFHISAYTKASLVDVHNLFSLDHLHNKFDLCKIKTKTCLSHLTLLQV